MKLSIGYLYTIFRYGYPPSIESDFRALSEIERMGFHYLEMEGLGKEKTDEVWQHRKELRRHLDDHGIHVHNFCAVDSDLVSLDTPKRKAAYERFRRSAELGIFLGTETLHLASYAPPVEYPEISPYKVGNDYSFQNEFRLRIPDSFSWKKVWDTLVESCHFAASVAAEFDRKIIMEPRVGEVICSVDSLLRLIDDVGLPNFTANFDTGHFSAQRENIPLALMKLEGRFGNIHVSDNNPKDANHLPIGEGTIDWQEFFRVLKRQNYNGYLGLDLAGSESIENDLIQSRDRLVTFAEGEGITLHY